MIPVDGKEGPTNVCVIELGGTIGKHIATMFPFMFTKTSLHIEDIEAKPFIEVLWQFSYRVGKAKL